MIPTDLIMWPFAPVRNALSDDRALAEQAGMDRYITKPIDIDKTIDAIRRFAKK